MNRGLFEYIGRGEQNKKVIKFYAEQMGGTIVKQGVISATRKGITTYAIFFLKPDDYHIGPENGISTDISPGLQPGVGVLGLFSLIDLAQVVCVLVGGILSALHLLQAVAFEKGNFGVAGQ